MAFTSRRAFAAWCGAGRVFTRQHQRPRASFLKQHPWGHDRIARFNKVTSRSYHAGYGSYSGGQSWDGLVYSIMANIRGQTEFGPECFYSAISSEDESDENSTGRRDIRDLVPLRLNRSSLQASARDIKLRLEFLCKSVAHTADYEAVLSLVEIAEKLAAMPSENPKLSLREYGDIWTTIRDGVAAANDMPLQVVSINEQDELRRVKWNAECCWGVAVLNAAMRGLDGSKIEQLVDDSEERRVTFGGDLRTMSYKINGLLLDSKDFFPEGERWFTREQEELILEAVVRVYAEAEKRRHM